MTPNSWEFNFMNMKTQLQLWINNSLNIINGDFPK